MMRRRLTPLLVLLLVSAASGREEEKPPTRKEPDPVERPDLTVTRDQIDTIARGLAWLARPGCQEEDGSWSDSKQSNATVAVTSLALLALMADGNTETRGRYSRQVREGVKFLLRCVTLTPDGKRGIPVGYIWVPRDEYSRMHGHGFATTVLALAYGMGDADRRKQIRHRLELAVALIERSQHKDTGGWWYLPNDDNHEGSVTVCEVQALRAAREAGIKVSKIVVDRAINYLERSQDPESGGFCYSLSDRKRQTYALTAAALSTLFGLGGYDRTPMIARGLRYMDRRGSSRLLGRETWFYYANFYAAQSLWQAAAIEKFSPYWREWWPSMREHLIDDQNPAGYWINREGGADVGTGEIYATAMATLILQVPLGILPMFQR